MTLLGNTELSRLNGPSKRRSHRLRCLDGPFNLILHPMFLLIKKMSFEVKQSKFETVVLFRSAQAAMLKKTLS